MKQRANSIKNRTKCVVLLLGPSLKAVSGVSTHLNQLFESSLTERFKFYHFQVGSEGRCESRLKKVIRIFLSPLQFATHIIKYSPDIVHINTSMDFKSYWRDLVYLLIAKIFNKKVVYQIHGGQLPEKFSERSLLKRKVLSETLELSDLIVVLSQEEMRAYKAFAPAARLELIANAVSTTDDFQVKNCSSFHRRALHLVFMGRLVESKGIFQLVQAFAHLLGEEKDICLTIAGSGPDEVKLKKQICEMGIGAKVDFVGVVTGEDKQRIWKQADLFVFPTYSEGLPYALLEGMAAGTPPIVSAVGAIPDLIENGVHGLLIPVNDVTALVAAIARLDSDRDLLCRMGNACRQRAVHDYSIERLAKDLDRAYLEVLS